VEAAVTDQRRVTRSAARSRKQILDLPLQYVIGWQPDRVAHPTAFQRVVDPGPGERSVRPDHDPVSASAVPINDGQQDLVPSLGAVDVARSEFRGEAVAVGVEYEERVIADGLEVAIVRGLLLRPMDGALGAVDVKDHLSRG
jgi:hypothetical protein